MTDRDYYGYVGNGQALYHFGILGMHWGIRRYQPYPKGHKGGKEVGAAKRQNKLRELKEKTELESAKNDYNRTKQQGKLEEAQSKLDVATAKASLQNVKKNPSTVNQTSGQQGNVPRTADPKKEELKQRIIRSGDPKLIKQYEKMLNNDEYRQAKDRMQMRNDLQRAVKDEQFNKAKGLIDKFATGAQSVGNVANNIKESYNKVADIQNFMNPNKKWKKIESKKPDYAEQQKRTAAATAREKFRSEYGFDPYTGNRAKAIYKPDGSFLRYATTEEESTGIINFGYGTGENLSNTSTYGPQPLNRHYMMV